MPTVAPEIPVAPANPSTPTPPAAPAVTPAPAATDHKEIANKLMKLLVDTKDAPVDAPPEKKVETPAAAAPTPAPVLEEKPIKVRKEKKAPETPPAVPKLEVPAAPIPPAAPKPIGQTDEEFEKGLLEEEREQLELARYAEKKFPDKYKGFADRTKNFLKEHAEKLGAEDFDETDPDYQKWVRANQPKMSAMEIRRIDEERITEKVEKKFEAKNDEMRHENYVRDEEPKVRAEGNRIHSALAKTALPDEVKQAFEAKTKELGDPKKAVEEVKKEYALEFEIADNIVNVATSDLEEFARLTSISPQTKKALKPFDPSNEQHNRIVTMVSEICREFKAEGGEALKRDGRWFATREEWQDIPQDQKKNWWTFSNQELTDMAMKRVPRAIDIACKQERERFEKRWGYSRARSTPAAAPTPPAAPPSPSAPAAPRPAPVPGAGAAPPMSIAAQLAARLGGGA